MVNDMALATVITARLGVGEAIEFGFKSIPVPILGQILGSVAGATISATVTYNTIRAALKAHTEIAQKTIVVVNELTVKNGL